MEGKILDNKDDYMKEISTEAQRKFEERNGIKHNTNFVAQKKKEIEIPRFIAEGKKPSICGIKKASKPKEYKRANTTKQKKKVKSYSRPKKKVDELALKRVRSSLAIIGLVSTIGVASVAYKVADDYVKKLTEGFWDDTKERIEKLREEKELLYGDTFPNGEKKRKLTHKEWEELPGDSKKYIQEPPLDDGEERD